MAVNKKTEASFTQYCIEILWKEGSEIHVACKMKYDKGRTVFAAATLYLKKNKEESSAQTLTSNDAYRFKSMYVFQK